METELNKNDLLFISDKPIVPEDVTSRIAWDDCGALLTFTGKVRSRSDGKQVLSLEHEATGPGAGELLQHIAVEMRRRWELGTIAISYRTGPVEAGGITLVIAVSAVHRQEAFAACQFAIDQFKDRVSAREILEDG